MSTNFDKVMKSDSFHCLQHLNQDIFLRQYGARYPSQNTDNIIKNNKNFTTKANPETYEKKKTASHLNRSLPACQLA